MVKTSCRTCSSLAVLPCPSLPPLHLCMSPSLSFSLLSTPFLLPVPLSPLSIPFFRFHSHPIPSSLSPFVFLLYSSPSALLFFLCFTLFLLHLSLLCTLFLSLLSSLSLSFTSTVLSILFLPPSLPLSSRISPPCRLSPPPLLPSPLPLLPLPLILKLNTPRVGSVLLFYAFITPPTSPTSNSLTTHTLPGETNIMRAAILA